MEVARVSSTYDVIVVGAGLAGLRAASVLETRGFSVLVVEKRESVGGRMSSHRVDGFVLDEGFQLINPAYPELIATGVLDDFDLRSFEPSVRFVRGDSSITLADPRRLPREAFASMWSRDISLADKLRAVRLFAHCGLGSAQSILAQRDTTVIAGLKRYGFSPAMIEEIWQPFLRGTLLEDDLDSSWRYTQLLLRSFFKGRPGTHPAGIAALPRALAAQLRTTSIHLDEGARAVSGMKVLTDEREYQGRAVIVATEPTDANVLIPGFTENERFQAATVTAEYDTEVVSSIPAGRWGLPDDIGAAAVYLADPSLSYHTGAEVVVDGAYSIMPPYLAVRAAHQRAVGGT